MQMMNPDLKYSKTDEGRAEIARRSPALSAAQRRLLIVIDGSKSVDDLAGLVRVGELDSALARLLQLDMIEVANQDEPKLATDALGVATSAPAQEPLTVFSPDDFRQVRQKTSSFVSEILGSASEPLCDAIERCDNPAELRKMLRGVEIFVGQRLNAETTQALAQYFRSLPL
jgi:hypothetical protein